MRGVRKDTQYMAETNKNHRQDLFARGYVRLELGSYRGWVLKNWHEYFVNQRWIKRNAYGQYVPYLDTIKVFGEMLAFYDEFMDARDFKRTLRADIAMGLKATGLL